MSITGYKDTDLIILSNLNDEDLFSLSLTNKTLKSLCEIESFWMKRLEKNFPDFRVEQEEFNNINKNKNRRTWKKTYLALVYYSNKYFPNKAMKELAKGGMKNIDLINFFIQKDSDNWNDGMKAAARGGHKDLVQFFIEKGANDWNWGMNEAVRGGNRDLVEFFIKKGAKKWDMGMEGAAEGGHKDLVDFFIEKGANNWNYGMEAAARGGHRDLVNFFIEKENE